MSPDEDEWVLRFLDEVVEALIPVEADLRTWDPALSLHAVLSEGDVVGVAIEGAGVPFLAYTAGRVPGEPLADLTAGLADVVQGEVMDQYVTRFWPSCSTHGRGLHAEVRGGEAVWWCRGGGHAFSSIGQLGLVV